MSKINDHKERRLICENEDCRLFNVSVDPRLDSFFDAKIGDLVKFGDRCPACESELTILKR